MSEYRPGRSPLLSCRTLPVPRSSLPAAASVTAGCPLRMHEKRCALPAVSGHPLYCVRSLWSSPVLCPQSLVIPCTVSAVSGHPLYCVRS
ncbi:unnamed protein product, partial [Staurois parvus]